MVGEAGGHGLGLIQQKIKCCGEALRVWGSTKTNPNTEEIKQLQKRLGLLNMKETIEDVRVEFLGVSKTLDDLLIK